MSEAVTNSGSSRNEGEAAFAESCLVQLKKNDKQNVYLADVI
jgi:hypothetical protein